MTNQLNKPVMDGGDKQDNKNSQHQRSVETLGLSGFGINSLEQLERFVEKCLTVQARLVIGSKDLRSPNKYEVLPIIMEAVSTFFSARDAREKEAEWRGELNGLSRVIPNYDGVGSIGYRYDDESTDSVDVRINQLDGQLSQSEKGERS